MAEGACVDPAPEGPHAEVVAQAPRLPQQRGEIPHLHISQSDELELRALLDSNGITVFYQPLVDLDTRRVCGWEALLRVRDDAPVALSTVEVIERANRHGLIDEVTKVVVADVHRTMLSVAELTDIPLTITVNMELDQFRHDSELLTWLVTLDWPDNVSVLLEVTERGGDEWTGEHQEIGKELEAAGFLMGLDDYGAGSSRMSFLHSWDWDLVKLDRMFVGRDNEHDRIVLAHTLAMLRELGVPSLIEGVETREQLRSAGALGVQLVQGYFLGRPMPSVVLLAEISRHGLSVDTTLDV